MKKIVSKLTCIIMVMILVLNFSSTFIMAVSNEIENNKTSKESTNISEERTFEDFKYKIENEESAIITGYTGNSSILVIPNEIDNCPVTKIAKNSFLRCETIQNITLPESTKEIGAYAFSKCTSLQEMLLPDGLTTIGGSAFNECTNLETINYPLSLKQVDYGGIFTKCNKLIGIEVPEGVTELPANIFFDSNLKTVRLPSTLKKIGANAFYRNKVVETIELPEGLTEIDTRAFEKCTVLSSITLPESLNKIGASAFADCTALKEIILPDGLTTLNGYVFEGCTNLEKINYPINLSEVGAGSIFSKCEKLTEITVPEGIAELPGYIFANSSLITVNLPSTLQKIGANAFYSNKAIETILIPEGVTAVGTGAFRKCAVLKNITLPESVKEIGDSAFSECISVKTIILPEGVTSLGSYTFSSCTNLEKINYPNNLVIVTGNYGSIFEGCVKLKEIVVPEGITELPEKIFACSNLTKVKLPSTLKKIGVGAFSQNKTIKTITIPEGVTTIGTSAFSNCTELGNIILPESLQELGNNVFRGCTKITEIVIPSNLTKIGYGCFGDARLLCMLYSKSAIKFIDDNLKNPIVYDDTKPTSSQILDYNQSSYNANFSSNYNGGSIAVICEYAIIDNMLDNVESITIKIPSDAELIKSSLYIDKEICQDFNEDNKEKKITIPVKKAKGRITFNIKKQNDSNFLSYAIMNYAGNSDYDVIGVINNEIKTISIEAASLTKAETIPITGSTKANQKVEIFIDDNLVTTIDTNKVGSYRASITLPNVENGKVYTIRAKTMDTDNQEVYAETQVRYSLETPTISSFNMIYAGNTYDLLSDNKYTVVFSSASEMKFEIKFTNPQNVKDVYVTSERNNVTKRIKAEWNEEKQAFITSNRFDADLNYVPGRMNVYYTDASSKQENVIDVELPEEQKEDLLDGATAELISETEDGAEVRVNLKDDITVTMKSDTLTLEETVRKVLSESAADKVLNYQNSIKMRAKSKAVSDVVVDKLLEMLKEEGKIAFIDGTKSIYFQDNISQTDIGVYIVDTTTGYVQETIISKAGEKAIDKFAALATKGVITTGVGEFCWNSFAGIYEAGKYVYDTSKEIESIRDSITSMDNLVKREQISKQLDEYDAQARAVATLKLLCTFVDATVTFTGAGLTPVGIAIKATTFILNNIVLGLMQEGIDRDIAQLKGTYCDSTVNWVIDPSGYVYETGTNNKLKDVKCELYYLDEETGKEVFWDASEYDQQNPIYTDNQGRYAWDVPEGKWKVKYSCEGYEPLSTEWMDVPPPQTDVNVGLISIKKYIIGDIDGNEKITTKDAKMVLQHIVKKITLTEEQLKRADTDGNTKITTKDAKLILQYIVKKITKFPVEQ